MSTSLAELEQLAVSASDKKRTGEPVTTTIDFILPNRRLEEIHSGKLWFSSQTTVTPVASRFVPHRFRRVRGIFFFYPFPSFGIFGKIFLRQDQETMIQQSRKASKHNPYP